MQRPIRRDRAELIESLKRSQKGLYLITTVEVANEINGRIDSLMGDFCGEINDLNLENQKLKDSIRSLFDEIKHGDKEHQNWLEKKIKQHFSL